MVFDPSLSEVTVCALANGCLQLSTVLPAATDPGLVCPTLEGASSDLSEKVSYGDLGLH